MISAEREAGSSMKIQWKRIFSMGLRFGSAVVLTFALAVSSGCGREGVAASVDTGGAEWLTSLGAATKAATEKKVPILVDFSGSDWCGWCIRLDKEVFSKAEFQDFAKERLVLLLVDFPRRKALPADMAKANRALAEKYDVQGFPTVILVDADGNELARTGYRPGGAALYVKHLEELLKDAGKR